MDKKQPITGPHEGYMRLPQILTLLPIGRSTWWAGCKTGKYPKPIKLSSRVSVWRAQEIYDLLERLGA